MLMPSQKAVQIAQPGRYLSSIREQRTRAAHGPHSLRGPALSWGQELPILEGLSLPSLA